MSNEDDVIYEGMWWAPSNPDRHVFGRFTFSRDAGGELELHGDLHEARAIQIGPPEFPNLLIGATKRRDFVYVLHGRWGGSSTSRGPNSYRSKVKAPIAFVQKGRASLCEFKEAEDVKFTKLTVHFAHLDQWFGYYLTDFHEEWGEDRQSVQMSYQTPTPIKIILETCDVTFRVAYDKKIKWRKRFEVELKVLVDINFETPKSLDECYDFIHLIRGFITLGLGIPTYPVEIFGKAVDSQVLEFLHRDEFPLRQKAFNGDLALFRLPDIRDELQTYLTNWFAKSESLKPVYDLYFSSRYNPHQYLHSHFISLSQALETYHRRKHQGSESRYMSKGGYKNKVRKPLEKFLQEEVSSDDLPSEFREKLITETLRYANQFSLHTRLNSMVGELSEGMHSITFLATEEDCANFVGRVCKIRNYLTHYAPESPVEFTTKELGNLTHKLQLLLEIFLLREMGFDFPKIENLMHDHWKYKPIFSRYG